jgi:hypothetical protein
MVLSHVLPVHKFRNACNYETAQHSRETGYCGIHRERHILDSLQKIIGCRSRYSF